MHRQIHSLPVRARGLARGAGRIAALRCGAVILALVVCARASEPEASIPATASSNSRPAASLGLSPGFQRLYNLDFSGAQAAFESWEKTYPENPMGPVSEAAGVLFSEFNRLGVLEAQFYEDDSIFAQRKKYDANPAQRTRFEQKLDRAEALAKAELARDAHSRDALLALTLTAGLRSDYAALIEKRNLASLHYTKEASAWATQLLAADPDCYDAHLASGISKYIIGSMAMPVRWLLRIGGVPGDKAGGIAELQSTAAHGHLLAPFARILLAIAYVREKDTAKARQTLLALQKDFPSNPLFSHELARLDRSTINNSKTQE
jgi:hypothetical protein